jgi:uncharacterized protein
VRPNIVAFGAGSLFAVGLAISGMTKPSKVTGFLDVAGAWDPSLAFVMVGAIAVHFIGYRIIRRRASPIFDATFHLPTRTDIDRRLVLGATLFGIGWGLGGFCPGPALVMAGSGAVGSVVFLAAMTIAMLLEQALPRALGSGQPGSPSPVPSGAPARPGELDLERSTGDAGTRSDAARCP